MAIFVIIIGATFFVALGGANLLFPEEQEDPELRQLYRLYAILEPKDGNFTHDFYILVSVFNETDVMDVFSIMGTENNTYARGTGNLLWSLDSLDKKIIELDSTTPTDMQFYWFDSIDSDNVRVLLPDESANMYQWMFDYGDYFIKIQLGPRYNTTTTTGGY